ncbi:hypothetical protein MsAc7_06870 [Methanolapillus millepedarum]|uniref:Uncharacterized protein n=1 Tax=Methanolapillus millepedarum TaxID=3028296 RepID=A0AA96ZTZ5_9EURY|nr:hypothetical protein MsAc7_06870 [Methanosarcinaceae archaeon Ac7]
MAKSINFDSKEMLVAAYYLVSILFILYQIFYSK